MVTLVFAGRAYPSLTVYCVYNKKTKEDHEEKKTNKHKGEEEGEEREEDAVSFPSPQFKSERLSNSCQTKVLFVLEIYLFNSGTMTKQNKGNKGGPSALCGWNSERVGVCCSLVLFRFVLLLQAQKRPGPERNLAL